MQYLLTQNDFIHQVNISEFNFITLNIDFQTLNFGVLPQAGPLCIATKERLTYIVSRTKLGSEIAGVVVSGTNQHQNNRT